MVILTNDNDESRRVVEQCYLRHKTVINPIIDWTDENVWEFVHTERIPVCQLYHEGFSRLGCIGCPMASTHGREREFARWPTYKKMYMKAFEKMLSKREEKGLMKGTWRMGTSAQDVFNWWMEYDTIPGQIDLLEESAHEDGHAG